jgi:hypothetical protein
VVTRVPGIARTHQLRIIGNGVVPQQAAAALRLLIDAAALPAAARGPPHDTALSVRQRARAGAWHRRRAG